MQITMAVDPMNKPLENEANFTGKKSSAPLDLDSDDDDKKENEAKAMPATILKHTGGGNGATTKTNGSSTIKDDKDLVAPSVPPMPSSGTPVQQQQQQPKPEVSLAEKKKLAASGARKMKASIRAVSRSIALAQSPLLLEASAIKSAAATRPPSSPTKPPSSPTKFKSVEASPSKIKPSSEKPAFAMSDTTVPPPALGVEFAPPPALKATRSAEFALPPSLNHTKSMDIRPPNKRDRAKLMRSSARERKTGSVRMSKEARDAKDAAQRSVQLNKKANALSAKLKLKEGLKQLKTANALSSLIEFHQEELDQKQKRNTMSRRKSRIERRKSRIDGSDPGQIRGGRRRRGSKADHVTAENASEEIPKESIRRGKARRNSKTKSVIRGAAPRVTFDQPATASTSERPSALSTLTDTDESDMEIKSKRHTVGLSSLDSFDDDDPDDDIDTNLKRANTMQVESALQGAETLSRVMLKLKKTMETRLVWAERVKEYGEKKGDLFTSERRGSNDGSPLFDDAGGNKVRNRWLRAKQTIKEKDPRNQILNFFNDVAQEGAQKVETEGIIDIACVHPLLRFINRASVFTVWRPTSLDAIRKMILGEAVGKGLDVKGKSAKRGKNSGFVPFCQITNNEDKEKVSAISKDYTIRLFFKDKKSQLFVADRLRRVAKRILAPVQKSREILCCPGAIMNKHNEKIRTMMLDEFNNMKWSDMLDVTVNFINDYAPTRYGLEITSRLFWEAFYVQQDINREPMSDYDGGRPSSPYSQDMNFKCVHYPPKEDAPRAVLLQNAGPDDPMNPFEILVAYEDQNRVLPVVSDFDCFLVGTRRVTFQTPLGELELEVVKWCVDEIQKVLETVDYEDTWTGRWIGVLKEAAMEGFNPTIPKFGFGDPKSYKLMENAVGRLNMSGAVRHGAECFNYIFPQDLDDEFLVIADGLPTKLPWTYVDQDGLTSFLSEKIDQGYTFPLNPKWILCDGGPWKHLYEKLLQSENQNTMDSMNVWFPKDSGLREKIADISERFPNGFNPDDFSDDYDDYSSDGTYDSDDDDDGSDELF